MKTSVHFRKFSEIRKAPARKKAAIKPYDSSKLEEKFKKEYMTTITALEEQIAAAKEEIERIKDKIEMDKLEIDERKACLEDRTIGLVSFSTLVRFYSRFLDSREFDAKIKMSDPIDDISLMEQFVEKLEACASEMESQLKDDDFDELETILADETREVERMENENLAARCSIEVRQLALPLRQACVELKRTELKPVEIPAPELETITVSDIEARVEASYYNALRKRQDALRDTEAQLSIAEETRTEFLATEAAKWRKKVDIMEMLMDDLDSTMKMTAEIDTLQKEVDRMKFEELKDSDAEGSRQADIAALRRIQRRIQEKKKEMEELKQKMKDMKIIQKKKVKIFGKRRAKLDELVKEIDAMEQAREDKEREISVLEDKLLLTEMLLNQNLREAQSMSNYVLPSTVYEMKNGLSPRIEEMKKIIDLVAVTRPEQ